MHDGSLLAHTHGVTVRIIEADITATCADGTRLHDGYRLATTLLDPDLDPAGALVRLCHERWEIESAYYALHHTLIGRAVLSNLLPARRARISLRKVKCPISRCTYANPEDPRPRSGTRNDSVTISVHAIQPTTAPFMPRRHPFPTVTPQSAPRPPSLIDRGLDVLRSNPVATGTPRSWPQKSKSTT
ncbi:hypothetical protein [Streptomyces sp. NPDC001594]|uniref:hypothetical protein n=1 Tax=Streptomyces sp. NPDC001594 TaxID=3364590 RepID=UPI003684133D